jgi:hypothetical protein
MSPNVSRAHHSARFCRSITFVLGLVQGGELVTVRATDMVKGAFNRTAHRQVVQPRPEKLKHSKFNTPEDLASFSQRFDDGLKKVFSMSNSNADKYVKFGSPRDNDPSCGIKAGRLALTG